MTLPSLPTGSAVGLAAKCPSSQVIPPAPETSEVLEAGTRKHAALDNRVTGFGPPQTDEDTRKWLNSIEDEHLAPILGCSSEVTLSWDPYSKAAGQLGHHLDRNYPRDGMVMYATADYVSLTKDGVVVADLKTGHSDTGPARDLPQLRALALMASRHSSSDSARVGILHATGSATWWDWCEFDQFDLALIEAELRSVCDSVIEAHKEYGEMGKLRPVPGGHCGRCRGRWACPAYTSQICALGREDLKKDMMTLLTPETASKALARYQAAKSAINDVGRSLMMYAQQYPIDVGNGKLWGPVVGTTKTFDAELAWPVLLEQLGDKGAAAAVSKKTSKAGIERGVVASGVVKGKAGKVREVVAALEVAGAVGEKTSVEYGEYERKGES